MTIQESIAQLKAYDGPLGLSLRAGADDALLSRMESSCGITLPDDFKEFYRFTDGFETEEDMFNMLSVADIIDNLTDKRYGQFHIAEYMIYSDSWQLEINPDDCNDYQIFVEAHDNKLVLTRSLAEFISRFLSGGVFENGGLYEWQEIVELQPIYTTKLATAKSLLTVFYYALRYNLLAVQDVKDWADSLITRENEPETFFIDLSLCRDKEEMISLLNSARVPESDLVARALLGLLNQRLTVGLISIDQVTDVLETFDFPALLTLPEVTCIQEINCEVLVSRATVNDNDFTRGVINFLANYQKMNIADYKHWLGYSYHVAYQFEAKQKAADPIALRRRQEKLERQSALIFAVALVSAFAALIIILITHNEIAAGATLSKFRNDLYQFCSLYLTIYVFYYLVDGIEWLIQKARYFKGR